MAAALSGALKTPVKAVVIGANDSFHFMSAEMTAPVLIILHQEHSTPGRVGNIMCPMSLDRWELWIRGV